MLGAKTTFVSTPPSSLLKSMQCLADRTRFGAINVPLHVAGTSLRQIVHPDRSTHSPAAPTAAASATETSSPLTIACTEGVPKSVGVATAAPKAARALRREGSPGCPPGKDSCSQMLEFTPCGRARRRVHATAAYMEAARVAMNPSSPVVGPEAVPPTSPHWRPCPGTASCERPSSLTVDPWLAWEMGASARLTVPRVRIPVAPDVQTGCAERTLDIGTGRNSCWVGLRGFMV
mmetsp:Transcript_8204/g.14641  ORF Transcript_8204/g.14641 Transcript_8204/m.14641 type:complete len:233 (-) Transcript_8204:99-797(-)